MAVTISTLFSPIALTGSATVIYTVPATPTTTVLVNARARFTNTSSGARQITLYAVPSGGSPGAVNCEMNAEALAANAHVDVDIPLLGPGWTIQAFADTAADVTMSALAGILQS